MESMRYFTLYPGLHGAAGDSITTIEPSLPDALKRPKHVIPEVWYIGSPLVQAGLLSEGRQFELLQHLRDLTRARGAQLVHYRHRSEKVDVPCPGVEIRLPDLPFEVYFGLSEATPLAIVSVISSVIIHMKLFFEGDCQMFFLDPEREHDGARIGSLQRYGATQLGICTLTLPQFAGVLPSIPDRSEKPKDTLC